MIRPIKVVHFITDLKRGGEARLLLSLLPPYRERGINGIICCLSRNVHQAQMEEQDLATEFETLGFRVVSLEASPARVVQTSFALFQLLREEKPDVLHTYLFHPNILGRIIGKLSRVPVIVSSVVSVDDWKRRRHSYLERLTSRLADGILVNAQSVADALVSRDGVSSSRITLAYNGVDIQRFKSAGRIDPAELGWSEDAYVVGAVCRLHPAKGLEYLLRAFRVFFAEIPQARLLIAGDGPLREKLTAQANQLGLGDAVKFLGARDDIPNIFAALDVFVISSIWEGIPGTIFEAMAARVPILSTTVGGIPEVLSDGHNALLVEPADPEALTAGIMLLNKEKKLAQELAGNAYEGVVRRFTFQQMLEGRIDFYAGFIKSSLSPDENPSG